MRAALMYGAGDVRVEDVPDARLENATDAVVRVVRACVCGSDLHPYHSKPDSEQGTAMGHEFVGVVEETGSDVSTVRKGDFVVSPFVFSDGTCDFCRDGLQTSCEHGGIYGVGMPGVGGAQAEAIRVPWADGTLVAVDVAEDSPVLPSLLACSDVFLTGHHAAVMGGVGPGSTVTVIGDGAVGLSAVLASRRLGAETVILMGRHTARTDLGREWGATDVIPERGDEGVAKVKELTKGQGSPVVLEAVGLRPAYDMAVGAVRPGGVISRVGVPQYDEAPIGGTSLFSRNVRLAGGVAPVRAYLEDVLPDVVAGRLEPGAVFDRTVSLEETPSAYAAMDQREALKVAVRP
ncbi:alcohol dehydrogenase catalytic domain-containing protein [Pseudokineococcus sp. 1T1Z-3]|uniref:alcohol dehydrogenase catalytic domain-containing protein n=1 Tax=Pseudokineococcus sp. 1T1Z-3 TaxID=3132745 RepID=UPI003099AD32